MTKDKVKFNFKSKNQTYFTGVFFLLAIFFMLPSFAQAYYTAPLRSWIKLYLVAYQVGLTSAEAEFEASHFDAFNSPRSSQMVALKALTSAPMLVYDNFYCLFVGDSKYLAMETWLAENHPEVNIEEMFVHFNVDTLVTHGGATHTLKGNVYDSNDPAKVLTYGSKVPSYSNDSVWFSVNWSDDVGFNANNSRVIVNAGSPYYQEFMAFHEAQKLETQYSGFTYDGFWVDNMVPAGITGLALNGSSASWPIAEYPQTGNTSYNSATILARDAAFNDGIVATFAAVRGALGPDRPIHANVTFYSWPQLHPHADVLFKEYLLTSGLTAGGLQGQLSPIRSADAAGVGTVIGSRSQGVTSTDQPQLKMNFLTMYYMLSSDKTYYEQQNVTQNNAQNYQWTPAIEYDVGQPNGEMSKFKAGIDPTSAKKDGGTFTDITGVGSNVVTLYDYSKNWSATGNGEWPGNKFVDSAGNVFSVYHSGTNWVSVYFNSPATTTPPVIGAFEIGTMPYQILMREFDNAVILSKPLPDYSVTQTGDNSATAVNLPITLDNPTGEYYLVKIDGTLDPAPLTQANMNNASGAILVKASKANLAPDTTAPAAPSGLSVQ